MHNSKLKKHSLFIISLALVFASSIQANAETRLYKTVKGWTVNQYDQSESSSYPSCSAVYFENRNDGLRIERNDDGYIFGFNGLDRNSNGSPVAISVWFDGDRSQQISGNASFVKDAAYHADDWLSFFHEGNSNPNPIYAIRQLNTISFSFMNPGNRTGNDEVTTTYKLVGSAAALLALDECFEVANGIINKPNASKTKQPPRPVKPVQPPRPVAHTIDAPLKADPNCPSEGPSLPLSGVCQGRGVNYLEFEDGDEPILLENCEWKLNEARMPNGDFLFYMATSCGDYLSKLEISAGAQSSNVNLVNSAMSEGASLGKLFTLAPMNAADPFGSILTFTQKAMSNQSEAKKCRVVYENNHNDNLVVDNVDPNEAARLISDGPRYACGPYGVNQESNTYWRVISGYIWHFDWGQDAYLDIDPRSITVVSADNFNQ